MALADPAHRHRAVGGQQHVAGRDVLDGNFAGRGGQGRAGVEHKVMTNWPVESLTLKKTSCRPRSGRAKAIRTRRRRCRSRSACRCCSFWSAHRCCRSGRIRAPRMILSPVPKLVSAVLSAWPVRFAPVKSATLPAPLPSMLMVPPMAPARSSVPLSSTAASEEPAARVAVTPVLRVSVPGPVMAALSEKPLAMVACAPDARVIAAASVPPGSASRHR